MLPNAKQLGRMMNKNTCSFYILIIATGLFLGCNQTSSNSEISLGTPLTKELRQATVTSQPNIELSPTVPPPSLSVAPGTVTPTQQADLASFTPFPALIAKVPLAPAGEQLTDIVLDTAMQRLYITDSSGQLHILDSDSYEPVVTLPVGGQMTHDPANQRLYLHSQAASTLTIVDTETLMVTGTLSATGKLGLDPTLFSHFSLSGCG